MGIRVYDKHHTKTFPSVSHKNDAFHFSYVMSLCEKPLSPRCPPLPASQKCMP